MKLCDHDFATACILRKRIHLREFLSRQTAVARNRPGSDINLNSCATESASWHVENSLLPEERKFKKSLPRTSRISQNRGMSSRNAVSTTRGSKIYHKEFQERFNDASDDCIRFNS